MARGDRDAATCGSNDTVSLKSLRLSHGIIAPIWGTPKEQPVLISVNLVLRDGFESAAGHDALDENTIHYGVLAKSIRKVGGDQSRTLEQFHPMLEGVVTNMAMRPDGSCKLSHATFTFTFPKASSYGEGVDIATTIAYDKHGKQATVQRDLSLKNVRLMVLIGVNDDERNQKQPVVVDFNLVLGQDTSDNVSILYIELFSIEQKLAKIIEDTDFETLEALANHTVNRLKRDVFIKIPYCKYLRLSLAKPLAVRHADASSVTVFRMLSEGYSATESGAPKSSDPNGSETPTTLKIIKPYA